MKLGKNTMIEMSNTVLSPNSIRIGNDTHINRLCIVDGRGGVIIGNSVSISCKVNIISGSHDINSSCFKYSPKAVAIEDYVWVGVGATILPGVKIGRGGVVAAGSVVTKDVPPYTVVAGIPAKKIAERISNLNYRCKSNGLFK